MSKVSLKQREQNLGYLKDVMTEENNTYGSDEIAEAMNIPLEIWPHHYEDTRIHVEHPEYTALCPRSGYPDFGKIVFDYIPAGYVCELKALKLFVNAFREERISHENVVNAIADKFMYDVKPKSLRIIGDFTRRGGIKTVTTVYRGDFVNEEIWTPYKAEIL